MLAWRCFFSFDTTVSSLIQTPPSWCAQEAMGHTGIAETSDSGRPSALHLSVSSELSAGVILSSVAQHPSYTREGGGGQAKSHI